MSYNPGRVEEEQSCTLYPWEHIHSCISEAYIPSLEPQTRRSRNERHRHGRRGTNAYVWHCHSAATARALHIAYLLRHLQISPIPRTSTRPGIPARAAGQSQRPPSRSPVRPCVRSHSEEVGHAPSDGPKIWLRGAIAPVRRNSARFKSRSPQRL